jgi:hypothetical protein
MTTAPSDFQPSLIGIEVRSKDVNVQYELPRSSLIYCSNEKDNDEGRFRHLLQDKMAVPRQSTENGTK